MTRIIKWLLCALLLTALFGKEAQANTYTAASCSESDVASAVSKARSGDTVAIPAGTCTWTTGLAWNVPANVIVQGAGSQSVVGGGDATTIMDEIDRTSGDTPLLHLTLSGAFRMTGITINGSANPTANTYPTYNGSVIIDGTSTALRVDHCHFYAISKVEINYQGWQYGVEDHCLHTAGWPDENQSRFGDGGWNSDSLGLGDQSWADNSYFGSSKFMFAENNSYQATSSLISRSHAFAFDCNNGGRFVFRYNTVGNAIALQTHGTAGDRRGCRAEEEYGNTFVYTNSPSASNYFPFLNDLESGSGLFWNNTVTGFTVIEREDTIRTNNGTYPESAPPAGWGYCGTAVTGVLSPWDQNTNSAGYRCIDQVGGGKGDLTTGVFPSKVNSTTSTQSWLQQVADPWYMWMNTLNPVPGETNYYWSNLDSATLENRDYYLELPNINESATFNGTAGMGYGVLSARPSTCTVNANTGAGVGWWATDTNTLYTCGPTANTWTAYYIPYTYPHPLAQSSSSGTPPSPAAPANLAAAVH